MAQNLRNALRGIVFNSFHEGTDKHAVKASGGGYGVVYSYSQRGALLDLVNNFSSWVKAECPDVKKPDQITADTVRAFLLAKSKICSDATLATYRSNFAKLGECVGKKYGVMIDWHTDAVSGERFKRADRGAGHAISKEEYKLLIDYAVTHPSGSGLAVILEGALGGRVTDVCERMTYDAKKHTIQMIGKGGKAYQERPLPAAVDRMIHSREFSAWFDGKEFQLPKSASVNKYLMRTEKKLGLDAYSFHDLRRYCAQRHYDALRARGVSRDEALSKTSIWLNHGPHRNDLMVQSYVIP